MLGAVDTGDEALREAVRLAPEEPNARVNLAQTLIDVGRFDEARKEADQARQMRDDGSVRGLLMGIAVFTRDSALEDEQRRWAAASAVPRDSLPVLWGVALYRGQMREAERLMTEIETVFAGEGLRPLLAQLRGGMAATLAMLQRPEAARRVVQQMDREETMLDSADDRLVTAFFLRDAAIARRMLPLALEAAGGDRDPHAAAALRALAAGADGRPSEALATLGPVPYRPGMSDRILLRAMLSLDMGQPAEALRDLEWLRDHGRSELSADAAVTRFLLAQTLETLTRPAEARQAYADFLAFWRQADRDLPMVVAAQAAVARLGS